MAKLHMMNAAGTAKRVKHARKLVQSEALTEVTIGSFTYEARHGNVGNVFYSEPGVGSLNSLGLPNGGLEYLTRAMPELIEIVEYRAHKRLRISIAGSNVKEIAALAKAASEASAIEVNLGCPNVWDGGKQKEIWAFNPERIFEAANAAREAVSDGTCIALKLSPYSDPGLFARVIETLGELVNKKVITEVVYANAYPNSFLWTFPQHQRPRTASAAISFGNGLAGGAGRGFLPYVLGGIRQIKERFPSGLNVTGVGGIVDGWSLAQYLASGVSAVQVNTAFYEQEDPSIFSRILTDFVEYYPDLATNYLE